MNRPAFADKSRERAARQLGMTTEAYSEQIDAGNRWCSAGRHWKPKTLFVGFNKRCSDCNVARRKKT